MRRSASSDRESQKTIGRRALMLGGAHAVFMGGLGLRMRQMQIRDAELYRNLTEENRISMQLIAPARGKILDRFGQLLADNRPTYQITVTRERLDDMDAVLNRLQAFLPITDDQIVAVLAASKKTSAFVPITVAERVTWEKLSRVAVNLPVLPGVNLETVPERTFPLGPDYAHVIGYVGRVSESDLAEAGPDEPLLSMPGFKIGKISIER